MHDSSFSHIFKGWDADKDIMRMGLFPLNHLTILFCIILDSFWISPLFAYTFSLKAALPMVLNNVISNTSFPFIPL